MAKYLVTGGCGFIGSALVERLSRIGHVVVVLDDLSTGALNNLPRGAAVEVVVGDICDSSKLRKAMEGCAGVFHLAAKTSVAESLEQREAYWRVNVGGTDAVMEMAKVLAVPRVVQASSAAAANPQLSVYAASKCECEDLGRVINRSGEMDVASLRFFNVYGPKQRDDSDYAAAVPAFLSAYRARRSATVFGTGLALRDYIFVSDVTRACCLAMNAPAVPRNPVDIGTGVGTTVVGLLGEMARALPMPLDVAHGPARKGELEAAVADVQMARSWFTFDYMIPLSEGIGLTYGSVAVS